MQHMNPPLPGDPYATPMHPYTSTHATIDTEAEHLVLRKIDRKAASLQKHGHPLEAMELLQQGLQSRIQLYGIHSEHVVEAVEKLALVYNSVAMAALYTEDYTQCLHLLRQADTLLTTHAHTPLLSVRIQTLNNLACCYRRQHRPKQALSMLRQSLQLLAQAHTDATVQQQHGYADASVQQHGYAGQQQNGSEHVDSRAVTHLNICAILSQLGK